MNIFKTTFMSVIAAALVLLGSPLAIGDPPSGAEKFLMKMGASEVEVADMRKRDEWRFAYFLTDEAKHADERVVVECYKTNDRKPRRQQWNAIVHQQSEKDENYGWWRGSKCKYGFLDIKIHGGKTFKHIDPIFIGRAYKCSDKKIRLILITEVSDDYTHAKARLGCIHHPHTFRIPDPGWSKMHTISNFPGEPLRQGWPSDQRADGNKRYRDSFAAFLLESAHHAEGDDGNSRIVMQCHKNKDRAPHPVIWRTKVGKDVDRDSILPGRQCKDGFVEFYLVEYQNNQLSGVPNRGGNNRISEKKKVFIGRAQPCDNKQIRVGLVTSVTNNYRDAEIKLACVDNPHTRWLPDLERDHMMFTTIRTTPSAERDKWNLSLPPVDIQNMRGRKKK